MYTVSNAILLAIWGLVNSKKAKQLLFFFLQLPFSVLQSLLPPQPLLLLLGHQATLELTHYNLCTIVNKFKFVITR